MDRAVAHFGDALSADLDNVEGKNKKEMERKRMKIFAKYLPDSASAGPKFRDPAKG